MARASLAVAGVVGGLAAAGLRRRHLDPAAGIFEQLDRGEADARPEQIDQAGDEQRRRSAGLLVSPSLSLPRRITPTIDSRPAGAYQRGRSTGGLRRSQRHGVCDIGLALMIRAYAHRSKCRHPDARGSSAAPRRDRRRPVAILGEDSVISAEDERRAYETDALTAYRAVPLAVVLPALDRGGRGGPQVSRRERRQGRRPRRRHVAVRRRAAVSRRVVVGLARMNRILVIDYDNRSPRVEAGVTNLNITNAVAASRLLLRARPVEPACLHHRRQYRHEFRRRPLPEIRRHHQQPPRRQAWC